MLSLRGELTASFNFAPDADPGRRSALMPSRSLKITLSRYNPSQYKVFAGLGCGLRSNRGGFAGEICEGGEITMGVSWSSAPAGDCIDDGGFASEARCDAG